MIRHIIDRLRGRDRKRIYESKSAWYACTDPTDTWEVGPCPSPEEAEAEIRDFLDPAESWRVTIALCTTDAVRVSDYVNEGLVEWLSDSIWEDHTFDGEPVLAPTPDQRADLIRVIKVAVDDWQERHGVVVAGCRFSRVEHRREIEL